MPAPTRAAAWASPAAASEASPAGVVTGWERRPFPPVALREEPVQELALLVEAEHLARQSLHLALQESDALTGQIRGCIESAALQSRGERTPHA